MQITRRAGTFSGNDRGRPAPPAILLASAGPTRVDQSAGVRSAIDPFFRGAPILCPGRAITPRRITRRRPGFCNGYAQAAHKLHRASPPPAAAARLLRNCRRPCLESAGQARPPWVSQRDFYCPPVTSRARRGDHGRASTLSLGFHAFATPRDLAIDSDRGSCLVIGVGAFHFSSGIFLSARRHVTRSRVRLCSRPGWCRFMLPGLMSLVEAYLNWTHCQMCGIRVSCFLSWLGVSRWRKLRMDRSASGVVNALASMILRLEECQNRE